MKWLRALWRRLFSPPPVTVPPLVAPAAPECLEAVHPFSPTFALSPFGYWYRRSGVHDR